MDTSSGMDQSRWLLPSVGWSTRVGYRPGVGKSLGVLVTARAELIRKRCLPVGVWGGAVPLLGGEIGAGGAVLAGIALVAVGCE